MENKTLNGAKRYYYLTGKERRPIFVKAHARPHKMNEPYGGWSVFEYKDGKWELTSMINFKTLSEMEYIGHSG